MHVTIWAGRVEFYVEEALLPADYSRQVHLVAAAVLPCAEVGLQAMGVFAHYGRQMGAADLLLALDKPAQAQGDRSARLLVSPNCLDSPKQIAFVVGDATRIEL